MKIGVISQGSISSQWTVEALQKKFDEVNHYDVRGIEARFGPRGSEVLYNGKSVGKNDCFYLKGSYRYADLLRAVTSILKGTCFLPTRDAAFSNVNDKLLTQLKLQGKVPMPKTYFAATTEAGKNILEHMQFPIIMKFPKGTHGKGVLYSESYESASSMLDALSTLSQPFLIQEYVETGGEDIRLIVVGDKIVAAMKRKAVRREKRANIHAGASGTSFIPNAETKKIAIRTAKILGLDIVAIDMLIGATGPMVLEANVSPGLQGITEVTKVNVAEEIASYLYTQTKMWTAKKTRQGTEQILRDMGVESGNTFISNLDFRGDRILLPESVSKLAKVRDMEEYEITAKKGSILIKKFSLGAKKEEEE